MKTLNDGSQAAPYLRKDLTLTTLLHLPATSAFSDVKIEDLGSACKRLKALGYVGVQHPDSTPALAAGLMATGSSAIVEPEKAEAIVGSFKQRGFEAMSVTVGNGLERADEAARLLQAVLDAAAVHDFPVYVETHRATITQDIRRTLDLVERFPEIRFNADLSHWYTGHEMNRANFDTYVEALAPVFERVRFVQGRIGNSGSIQIDIRAEDRFDCIEHHRKLWTLCFEGFLANAGPGDFLPFNPEVLPPAIVWRGMRLPICYGREFRQADGSFVEEGDRWGQAQLYWEMAQQCFALAQKNAAKTGE